MDKNELIDKIIEKQTEVITNLKNSVLRYKNASDIDENDSIDPEDFSHQDEANEMQIRYEQMAIHVKSNLAILETYKNKNYSSIESGALVETESLYIFIGTSISQFDFNNKKIITISEQAPIFEMLKTKSIGDKIVIGSNEYTILSIS